MHQPAMEAMNLPRSRFFSRLGRYSPVVGTP